MPSSAIDESEIRPALGHPFSHVDISAHTNSAGFTFADSTGSGAMNVWRNSLPAEEFPSGELVIEGVPFHPPRPRRGADDHVTCDGQLLAVAEGGYDWLYLLACSERRVEEEIALHFTGGQVDFEPLRVSDFWAAVPFFGESAAFTSAVMHYPHHVQPRVPGTIWCQRVPVVRRAPLAAVRLPRNAAVHVFAATLVRCG